MVSCDLAGMPLGLGVHIGQQNMSMATPLGRLLHYRQGIDKAAIG